MEFPGDLRYTEEHEWIRIDGDVATVGITEFAQSELGEIVFAELPDVGQSFAKSDSLCVLESTKAASDVYAPVSGEITEVNEALADAPDSVNSSPYADGWLVKLKLSDAGELDGLMTADKYQEFAKA